MIPTRTLRRFAPLTLAWMVLLGTTLAVAATSPAIPLNNAGFETAGPGNLPQLDMSLSALLDGREDRIRV